MIIVGAGMAGLLAAAMLREEATMVVESQTGVPNNHTALLRFRSSIVGDTLNIPFKEVTVMKASAAWRNPIADAMAYSHKTNGTATLRSIASTVPWGQQERRYIAPPDLIARMVKKVTCKIQYGQSFDGWTHTNRRPPIISTIPMPSLIAQLLGDTPLTKKFQWVPGHNIVAELAGVDAYCSLYVPQPELNFSRISLTGSRFVAECYGLKEPPTERDLDLALAMIGLDRDWVKEFHIKEQSYAKILPIAESERRNFITWASRERGIYSLGRFATWRPGILLDDLVNDVRVIQRLANRTGEDYDQAKR